MMGNIKGGTVGRTALGDKTLRGFIYWNPKTERLCFLRINNLAVFANAFYTNQLVGFIAYDFMLNHLNTPPFLLLTQRSVVSCSRIQDNKTQCPTTGFIPQISEGDLGLACDDPHKVNAKVMTRNCLRKTIN
jgi:hypothetical protein